MKQIKNLPALLIIGAIAGGTLFFSPAAALIISLFLYSIFCIKRFIKTESTNFLVVIFIIGFIIRVPLAAWNYNAGLMPPFRGGDTQPDAVVYNSNAFYVAHVLKGGFENEDRYLKQDPILALAIEKGNKLFDKNLPGANTYQYGSYVFLIGVFYSIFGYAPVAAKLLNSLAGCWIPVLTYIIAKNLIKSERPARISAILTMFLPSLVYWSVSLLRDSIVDCIFLLYVSAMIIYAKSGKKSYLFAACISIVASHFLKDKITILLSMGIIILLAFKFFESMMKKKILTRSIVIFTAVIIISTFVLARHSAIAGIVKGNVTLIMMQHKSSSTEYVTASGFKIYADNFYRQGKPVISDIFNPGMPFVMLKALVYYFLSPFPWRIPYGHAFFLLFYPQVIFMFLCLPFMMVGILGAMRRNFALTVFLIILLLLVIMPQAMAEGIIGNVIRHRDMFTPFILIFSGYGFYIAALQLEKKRRPAE